MNIRRIAFFLSVLFLAGATIASAQNLNFKNMSAEQLQEALARQETMLIVDTRTSREYEKGHIPTAINIPPQDFNSILSRLPENKELPIIFYCRGFT